MFSAIHDILVIAVALVATIVSMAHGYYSGYRRGHSERIRRLIEENQLTLEAILARPNSLSYRIFIKTSRIVGGVERVQVPPGHLWLKATRFFWSKKTYERVFLQAVIDMREEHYEALAAGEKWRARSIVVRGHLNLLLTIIVQIGWDVVAKIVKTVAGWGAAP